MTLRSCLALFAVALLPLTGQADLLTYSQDFENLTPGPSDPAALSNDGWLVGANVFDPGGNFLYNYFSFPAGNGGGNFTSVASGDAGPNQGTYYLNAYSDYNNGDHGNGNYIEGFIFQEQTIGASDLGKDVTFTFDYLKNPDPANDGNPPDFQDSTTYAFVKVLDSVGGTFATLGINEFETTNASTTVWSEGQSISLNIDSAWEGQLVQFGFRNYATNYNDTGIFYDNLNFSSVPEPSSALIFGLGCVGFGLRRRRK